MKRAYFIKLFHCIFSLLLFQAVFAKTPYTPQKADPFSEPWRFTHYSELDGKGIRDIAYDRDGNVWFAINMGVVKYNGYEWNYFTKNDGVTGGAVHNVLTTKNGEIFASTQHGIFKYRQDHWKKIFPFNKNLTLNFQFLKELKDGRIACGLNNGMLIISDNTVQYYSTPENAETAIINASGVNFIKLPENATNNGEFDHISDLIEYKPGRLWMALTVDGSGRILSFAPDTLNGEQINQYEIFAHNKNDLKLGENQKFIKSQKNGDVWVINRSYKIGINRFDGNNWNYIKLNAKFGGDEYTTSITESYDGTIWIGGLGKVITYDGSWKSYNTPEYKIPAAQVLAFKGSGKNMWIVGQQSKVYSVDFSRQNWHTYENLNFQCEGPQGKKWFIDVHGKVVVKNKEKWEAYTPEDGLIDAPVRIISTSAGQLWAAGSHKGTAATAYFNDGTWVKQIHDSLSWGIDYRAVYEDSKGSLWFGGSVDRDPQKGHIGGVLKLQNPLAPNKQWKHIKYDENGLQQSNAYGIGESKDGTIWIGGSYLYKYDGSYWEKAENDHFREFINIVKSDGRQNLYIGSRYYGVFIYDGKQWEHYNTENGLESNIIISICPDENQNLWVATDNDISFFDGSTWINNVFPEEMVMSNEGGSIHSSNDGSIWINKSLRGWKRRAFTYTNPTQKAFENFKTYRYHPDDTPPETEITLFSKEVSKEGNTLINWEGYDYFNDTPKNRLLFSYRLDNGEWSEFKPITHHTLTGLNNGTYTFEVRAKDKDNNVDPTPAKINFEVLPPVWKQAWFIAMITCFILLMVWYEIRVFKRNKKLSILNNSLNNVNFQLKQKNQHIASQYQEILKHQTELEESNQQLESQNQEIETQRDKLQNMVQKLDSMSKAKIRFFTNITHEFRTPLTLILGPVDRLLEAGLSRNEQNKMLKTIKKNATRLQNLINQLLEFRKIETGTLDLHLKREDIVKFVKEIKESFNSMAEEKAIDLSFNADVDSFKTIFDRDKIEKIIFNLLSNAFKYTPEKGTINISLNVFNQEFDNNLQPDRNYLIISVTDSGQGIAPEHLEHIFERYYSYHETGFDPGQSSGIGLSYIKDLAAFHQGQITVDSQPGQGTRFSVFIPSDLTLEEEKKLSGKENNINPKKGIPEPAIEDEQNSIPIKQENGTAGNHSTLEESIQSNQKYTLLVVEDNPDMREFLRSILLEQYQIIEAGNGMEGWKLLQENDVDLILSDIMMPEMDGISFCKKMKNDFATSHIPLILLTAKNQHDSKIEGYETGADDYIIKPFNARILHARIHNLIEVRNQLKNKFSRDFTLEPKAIQVSSSDEKLLQKLTELMEENIDDSEFDVNRLCELVNLSHMQFIRKVKHLTGKKPVDLLKSFRLKRAKQLLEQDKLNISEIAYMVGYDLPNSFSRAFRKEFGISPREFLDENRLYME